MKIPKYIDEALKRRTKAAIMFDNNDLIISEWIEKNGLTDDVDTSDIYGGAESIVHPEESERNIREAILRKEKR